VAKLNLALAFILGLTLACSSCSSEVPAPRSLERVERDCAGGRDFPRCVRLTGGEDTRNLAFQALTEYAGDFFFLNCVHAHTEAYYVAVGRANAIELDIAAAGDVLVLPQPACGDATLTVSTATAALLDQISATLFNGANDRDGEARLRLEALASASAADALLTAIDREALGLGLGRGWQVGAMDFVYAAPVSVSSSSGIVAVLVMLAVDEVTCQERLERFVLTGVVVGEGAEVKLEAAKLHRNRPVEASLARCAA
jgi:hypothetical protein